MRKIIKIRPGDKGYPENLKDLTDRPEILYLVGEIKPEDRKAVAIVGTRRMTDYGRKIAWNFAFSLAKQGVVIVSGLARGIDAVAYTAALKAGGRTLAVLGSGLDIVYPAENKGLAEKIVRNGALISEFSLGTKPLGENFLIRNRIISGLSLAVLVIEGARKSGTLSTASYAANQGREVFAVPGSIDSVMSGAPHFLIENGAAVASKPEDILDYLKSIP